MARKPRIEYAGAVYHVMSRGDRKNDIFRFDQDRRIFLKTLSEACDRQGWLIHAYVLMGNHYHLLLETPEPNLVVGMKWLQGTYTQRFNNRYEECGHLFQGRYKALVVQADRGDYFSIVASYIHLNPVRKHLLDFSTCELSDYAWSSYPLYFDGAKRPNWLCVSRVLSSFQWLDDRKGLEKYRRYMQKRAMEVCSIEHSIEFDERWKAIRWGWCLGDDDFRTEMEDLADKRISNYDRRSYVGNEAKMHDEREAERLIIGGLEIVGVSVDQLPSLRKTDPRKKVVAWLIRRNTSIKNQWICEKLFMGHVSNLARYVREVEESSDAAIIRLRNMMKKKRSDP
jgi:REP element-mobilizing transposase RayT